MDCRATQNRLFELADGTLPPNVRAEVEAHLGVCPACAELARAVGEPAPAPEEGLTAAILARTSGETCPRAEALLPEWVDGQVAAADLVLLRAHLAHCAGCRGVARVMERMAGELPTLREVHPDERFVDDVLAATLSRPVRAAPRRIRQAATSTFDERFVRAFRELMRRPRIAWEAAYVATMLLALVFSLPGSPLAEVPRRALDVARRDPAALATPVRSLEREVTTGVQSAWAGAEESARVVARDVAAQSSDLYAGIQEDLGTLWQRLASPQARARSSQEEHRKTKGEEP